MSMIGLNNIYREYVDKKIPVVTSPAKPEGENKLPSAETEAAEKGLVPDTDSIEISEEGRLAEKQARESQTPARSDPAEQDNVEETEKNSGKVAVNVGKRSRQIAAAQTQAEIQQVLALLQEDMADCKAGLEKGWCDESEIAKVEALISKAKAHMSEISPESDDAQSGIDAFDLASLF